MLNFDRPKKVSWEDEVARYRVRLAYAKRTEKRRRTPDAAKVSRRRRFAAGKVCDGCHPACGRDVYAREPFEKARGRTSWVCGAAYKRGWRKLRKERRAALAARSDKRQEILNHDENTK